MRAGTTTSAGIQRSGAAHFSIRVLLRQREPDGHRPEPTGVAAFGNYRDANDGGRIDTSIAGMLRFPGGATALFDTGVNLSGETF